MDTQRRFPFARSRDWKPSSIDIFGHTIAVDIPTGNLVVSTTDIAYPFYSFSLGIARKYDAQEQHMQLAYRSRNPNVDPKPHWFGNWQFSHEAAVDDVWRSTLPEIHITSGIGADGLFETTNAGDFQRDVRNAAAMERVLRSYGIPVRTSAAVGWRFTAHDFVLRTLRGPFQILTGHFSDETLVDDVDVGLWLFNPITGTAFHITGGYFYRTQSGDNREIGYPTVVAKLVDALGHTIALTPSTGSAPFRDYNLVDGSGRAFNIQLDHQLAFLDGLNPRANVHKYLVSTVIDRTKSNHNVYQYDYNAEHLLEEVRYPSEIAGHQVRYHYDDPDHPGVLTGIESFDGHWITFEYEEDPEDLDHRLAPRLKVRRIKDPEGIALEYDYYNRVSRVTCTITQSGQSDRQVHYTYIRDGDDTKKRYITATEIEVARGFLLDSNGNVVPRVGGQKQLVRREIGYSEDGRFNIVREKDPLGRVRRHAYNDFNQPIQSWDFDNHWTRRHYDVPPNPSPTSPRRYDLLKVERQNVLRMRDPSAATGLSDPVPTVVAREVAYVSYDAQSSPDATDHGAQSTHRPGREMDERGKYWKFFYNDANNYTPAEPTSTESPLGVKAQSLFDHRGQLVDSTDPEGNSYKYEYDEQGRIVEFTDPNGGHIKLTYYQGGNWLHTFEDELRKTTTIVRRPDGRIDHLVDPVGDRVDYRYQKNGRLLSIIRHRPVAQQDPTYLPAVTAGHPDLETKLAYTTLGDLAVLTSPSGLALHFEYDEAGRRSTWYHDVPAAKQTRLVYDAAGQLVTLADRNGRVTTFEYANSGLLNKVSYPAWFDGTNQVPVREVGFPLYDYLGRVLRITDSERFGLAEFAYDAAGTLIFRRDHDGHQLDFHMDDEGRIWKIEDALGDYVLEMILDDLGRPKTIKDSVALDGQLQWQFKYNKALPTRTNVLRLYERTVPAIGLVSWFDYDTKNRLRMLEHGWGGANPTSFFGQTVTYQDDGLIDGINGDDPDTFAYDGVKQLIHEETSGLSSDFDKAGNRLYRADRSAIPDPPASSYSVLNQLQTDAGLGYSFQYDNAGNTISSPLPGALTKLYFDGQDKLRVAKNTVLEVRYDYDVEGRLIERRVTDLQTGNTERTRLRYVGTKPVVVERDGNLHAILTWDHTGRLLRIRKASQLHVGSQKHSLFLLQDRAGSMVRYVDANMRVRVEVSYDPWGAPTKLRDPDGLLEPWGFQGKFTDEATRLILIGDRWYEPKVGRWLTEDPLPSLLSRVSLDYAEELVNLYAYVHNSPVSYVDDTGLATETVPRETWEELKQFARESGANDLRLRHVTKLEDGRKILSFASTPTESGMLIAAAIGEDPASRVIGVPKPDRVDRILKSAKTLIGKGWLQTARGSFWLVDLLGFLAPESWGAREGDPEDFVWQGEQENNANAADVRG